MATATPLRFSLAPWPIPSPGSSTASDLRWFEGFSLHAATRVPASDRRGLWRLCAYGARGAIASSRLSELPDGRFAWDIKRPLPDGCSRIVMTGVELIGNRPA